MLDSVGLMNPVVIQLCAAELRIDYFLINKYVMLWMVVYVNFVLAETESCWSNVLYVYCVIIGPFFVAYQNLTGRGC